MSQMLAAPRRAPNVGCGLALAASFAKLTLPRSEHEWENMRFALVRHVLETIVIKFARRHEMESAWLRRHFIKRYDIEVGAYSYGCFDQWRVSNHTKIGRYCSFAKTVRIIDANHPVDALSTHPFFYSPEFGASADSREPPGYCVIEDDVWLSHNVTVTPGCKRIGRGAIIGAGAVVTKDIPPYAIASGVPARVTRMRFSPEIIEAINKTQWWTLDRRGLQKAVRAHPKAFSQPTVEVLNKLANWLAVARP